MLRLSDFTPELLDEIEKSVTEEMIKYIEKNGKNPGIRQIQKIRRKVMKKHNIKKK